MISEGVDVRLVGPGGAGKSTVGAVLAQCLGVTFVDLDQRFKKRFGDISEYVERHGYDAYARANVDMYRSLPRARVHRRVVALSSGFMTYRSDIHSAYSFVRREVAQHRTTFVLLPSVDRSVCVAEIVRRQLARRFRRSPTKEEAVIRARFDVYMDIPAPKIETMRPLDVTVAEIVSVLAVQRHGRGHDASFGVLRELP